MWEPEWKPPKLKVTNIFGGKVYGNSHRYKRASQDVTAADGGVSIVYGHTRFKNRGGKFMASVTVTISGQFFEGGALRVLSEPAV